MLTDISFIITLIVTKFELVVGKVQICFSVHHFFQNAVPNFPFVSLIMPLSDLLVFWLLSDIEDSSVTYSYSSLCSPLLPLQMVGP